MINYSKLIIKESDNIVWLSVIQVVKETLTILIAFVIFALFLSGVNWLLQQAFIYLL